MHHAPAAGSACLRFICDLCHTRIHINIRKNYCDVQNNAEAPQLRMRIFVICLVWSLLQFLKIEYLNKYIVYIRSDRYASDYYQRRMSSLLWVLADISVICETRGFERYREAEWGCFNDFTRRLWDVRDFLKAKLFIPLQISVGSDTYYTHTYLTYGLRIENPTLLVFALFLMIKIEDPSYFL